MALIGGASACCDARNVSIGPCEWQCGGCNFHADFARKVGCAVTSSTGSCRRGWERAVCSCTNPCPEQPLPPAPPLMLSESLLDVVRPWRGNASSHVARRMSGTSVAAGAGTLQAALNAASDGDELVLADGKYTGSGGQVLSIGKSITIRALNAGQAILDGENARTVVYISSGTVVLSGLHITKVSLHTSRNLGGASTALLKCLMCAFCFAFRRATCAYSLVSNKRAHHNAPLE